MSWDISAPADELHYEPKTFTPMPNAFYKAALLPECAYASGGRDDGSTWEAIDFKFSEFVDLNGDDKFAQRTVDGRLYGDNHKQIIAMARALGLATESDGVWKPESDNLEAFVDDANAMAGTICKVYVQTLPRRRKNKETDKWEVQINEASGQPWRDTRVKSVEVAE